MPFGATGVVRAATPTGYLESRNLGSNFWQERLLNGAGNLQFVCNLLDLVLGFGLAQRGFIVGLAFLGPTLAQK